MRATTDGENGTAGRNQSQEGLREASTPPAAIVTAVVLQGGDDHRNAVAADGSNNNGTATTSTKSDQLPDYKDQVRRSAGENATIVAQGVHVAESMKPDQLPDYKDQARRSAGENATLLAQSVHAVHVEEEPEILPAAVMQTFPPGINAKNTVGSRSVENDRRRGNNNINSNTASAETPPDSMETESKRRRRIVWGLVVVSVAILAGVAIAVAGIMVGGGSSSDESSSVERPPTDSSSTSNSLLPTTTESPTTIAPSTIIPLEPPTDDPMTVNTLSPIEPLPPATMPPVQPAVNIENLDSEVKLTASDAAADDQFGFSVAFNGVTLVVGSWNNNGSGSAYVYTRSEGAWTEQAKLTSGGAADERFGYSLAINHGDTIVIGAYQHTGDNFLRSGCAFVYTLAGAVWTEQAKLFASDAAADDRFGYNVAINWDTIVIGAFSDDDNGIDSGSAYVYIQSGSVWTEQAKLTASDGAAGDEFGLSVTISGDTIAIGAWYDETSSGIHSGSAYVYSRSGTVWTEQAQLTASDGAPADLFGLSVTISGDTIVIGAYWDDAGTVVNRGSAYVYIRSGTVWTEQAKLAPSDGAGFDFFGYRVATDGANMAIGAYGKDNTGSAYLYTRSGSAWTEQAKLTASDGAAEDLFGISVAVAGGAVVIGASSWDSTESGINSGSVYVFY